MMSSPPLILTVVASVVGRSRLPCRLTPVRIVSSTQEEKEAWASSSHFAARSGSAAWISMYRIAPPLPNTRQYRRGPRVRHPAGRPHAAPQADAAPEAEPQVPQCGGGLTRALVHGPLLGGGTAVLVLAYLVRQRVSHRSSIR